MATTENKLSLKVLVNSETKKVLFAEADCDFVDVLYGFLTLPVGTIIRQLEKHLAKDACGVGCLSNLYASVRNLSSSSFSTEQCKLMLLHPANASESKCQKLKLKIDDSEPTKYFFCNKLDSHSPNKFFISSYENVRCSCGSVMSVHSSASRQNHEGSSNEIFTAGTKSYIISEDLGVMPYVKILNFQVLQNLVNGVDFSVTEEHILDVGLKEIMLLLKLSLTSGSPLTTFFCALRGDDSSIINPESVYKVHSPRFFEAVKTDVSIELKALVHKSTRKALIFMAGDDFVELLFRILTIPLGSVVSLLGGSSSIGTIDNLYKSISDLTSEFFSSSYVKHFLINPKLPFNYLSTKTNKLLPLCENPCPSIIVLIDPKGSQGYIKGQQVFMITDDLVVSPLSPTSILSYLFACNVRCSDVEELVFEIGTNEALDILRASFTSSDSVLSNALKISVKQPKKEK